MNQVLFIARQHLAALLRQRESLLWVFVMPPIFFYFIGTVTGGFGGGGGAARPVPLVLEGSADAGFLADELVSRLEAQNYAVERVGVASEATSASPAADRSSDGESAGERATDAVAVAEAEAEAARADDTDSAGTIDSATATATAPANATSDPASARRRLVLPAPPDGYDSLTESVLDGQVATLELHRRGEGTGVQLDQVRVGRAVYGLLADMLVADEEGSVTPAALREVAEAERPLTLRVESAGHRVHVPIGYEQTIPGTTVMFTMLILLTSGALLLVIEREQGLLRRLASTPITRAQLVAGKWIGAFGLALVQLAFAILAGRVLFGMDWGPDFGMVLVILLAWAMFNTSLALLLASVARSEAQMSGIGVVASMVFAALGGCWWPIEVTPDWMQSFSMLLPTGWAMDAMHHLVSFGDGAASVLPHLLLLLLGTVVLAVFAVRRFRYQ